MRSESDMARDVAEGERARQLLKDPMIVEALTGMRETVYHNIRTSSYKEIEEREELYKMLKAIDAFEDQFKRRIDRGQKAKTLLEKLFKS